MTETKIDMHKKPHTMASPAGDQKLGYDAGLLSFKLEEQQKLIEQLKLCFKTSEDKRKVMETRSKNLLAENRKLKSLLDIEQAKMMDLQKRTMQVKVTKTKDINQKSKRREHFTERFRHSAKPLHTLMESATQTEISKECPSCASRCRRAEGTGISSTLELSKLGKDMQQLKEVLNKREQTWTKIAERDRELRERIARLNSELSSVRQIASMRSENLHEKCTALKVTKTELSKARKELSLLKKCTKKLQNEERSEQDSARSLELLQKECLSDEEKETQNDPEIVQ